MTVSMNMKMLLRGASIALLWTVCSANGLFSKEKGMMCRDQSIYSKSLKPEIIRSWSYAEQESRKMFFETSFYVPRFSEHTYAPEGDQYSKKYEGLDLFWTASMGESAIKEFVQLSFQREAKVYLMVHMRGGRRRRRRWARRRRRGHQSEPETITATLPGWKSEGPAVLVKGDGHEARFGVQKHKYRGAKTDVFVFSKSGRDVVLPNKLWVMNKITGISTSGWFNVLVAEKTGLVVEEPVRPAGISFEAGGRCPNALHEKWRVDGHDVDDPVTSKMSWRTFHPLWDPCYWCAYDHEHGSDPVSLMGYVPKFGYTAFKNYRQDESHGGFKGFVLQSGNYFFYFQVHAHLSKPIRFHARTHTLVIAVTDVKTKDLMVELHFKADFGVAATKLAGSTSALIPLDRDKALFDLIGRSKGLRQINVFNPENPDKRLRTNQRIDSLGNNEHWFTTPICSTANRRGVQVDFKNPGTALRTLHSDLDDFVRLGREVDGEFVQRTSNKRDLRVKKFRIAQNLCNFELQNIHGHVSAEGKFYTDPFGRELLGGYGKYAIAQIIKPGFSFELEGKFNPSDTWLGLHEADYDGEMKDVSMAIDPNEN